MAAEVSAMDALAVAHVSNRPGATGVEETKSLSGSGVTSAKAVKESERSAEVVKREMELVKNLRTDLNFYSSFLPVVSELQYCYQALGHDKYRAAFGSSSGSGSASGGAGGFGHWKRMKDLKKIDWSAHRAAISAVVERVKAELGGAESGNSESGDDARAKSGELSF